MSAQTMAFWSEHPVQDVFAAIDAVLGESVHRRVTGQFKGHHIVHVGYAPDLDLPSVESRLRQELDAVGWQFVTTGRRLEVRGGA